MTTPTDRFGLIRLSAKQLQHSELLTGLELWLQLGLLSPQQVEQFCRDSLTCALQDSIPLNSADVISDATLEPLVPAELTDRPRISVGPAVIPVSAAASRTEAADFTETTDFANDFIDPDPVHQPILRSVQTSWVTRTLQAFMAEIGVIWLLCLGVFMVVVSSGVLAASQWQNFAPVAQYGILATYTLAFWVASLWTSRNPALRLTTRMLQITTLLIIPVNFWMMDGLSLWQSGVGVGINLLAAVALSAITVLLIPQAFTADRLTLINMLSLSGLHWGWGIAEFPLIATYIGTIGTAGLTYWQLSRSAQTTESGVIESPITESQVTESGIIESPITESPITESPITESPITESNSISNTEQNDRTNVQTEGERISNALDDLNNLNNLDNLDTSNDNRLTVMPVIIALATLLLIGRAILAAQIPFHQLGLAFGVCGWLFCWRYRFLPPTASIGLWTKVGVGLLIWGWLITVEVNPPWQAVAISGLALWLLSDRLRRQTSNLQTSNLQTSNLQTSQLQLVALLLVGLQTYGLLGRLLPIDWRNAVIATATQGFGAANMPIVLLSLFGFPYLWLMLHLAQKLRRPELVRTTEQLALGLGLGLTLLSLFNPGVRTFTLTLAAFTLTLTLLHRRLRPDWIYLNHVVILAAIAAWVDWTVPEATPLVWARILLVAVAIEWGLSSLPTSILPASILPSSLSGDQMRIWQKSGWHLGLGLAGLSYSLLYSDHLIYGSQNHYQNLIWLITPILLTGLSQIRFPQPRLAAWVSTGSLIAQLFLLDTAIGWMMTTAIAIGLMLINQRTLRQMGAAVLTIGFVLGFEVATLYQFFLTYWTFDWGLLWFTVNFGLLWLAETALMHRGQLSQLYASALSFWGKAIGLFSLISLSLSCFAAYTWVDMWTISPQLVIGSSLIAITLADQLRRRSTNSGFYCFAWASELVAATIISGQQNSIDRLAIVTLALGLISQLTADWVVHRRSVTVNFLSWHLIPLLYAGLGLSLGHHSFTATTGLYTIAAALIGIGVGRRQRFFQPLTLAALSLVSIGFYQLLIYQLTQASGIAGDGLTLLAGLALLIAIVDRLAHRWLQPYLRLDSDAFIWIAHLHWGVSSGLALSTLRLPLSPQGLWLWLLIGSLLAAYALLHGRDSDRLHQAETWTYLGILEALIFASAVLYRALPNTEWLLTWAGTLAAIVATWLYVSPWLRWGWPQRPWSRIAIGFPGAIVVLTTLTIGLQSLLIVAAFYAWVAKVERQPRISYVGLCLFDWAALRFLATESWLNSTWISALIALSLLYIAQLDPDLQDTSAREKRHWLRVAAIALLSLALFYQAELESAGTALILRLFTGGWAIGLICIGLVLRVRAWLYVGTLTFVLQVLRFLGLFVYSYSFLLWAIGILIGLIFIWVAATFEARRSQMGALMQYWLSEFADWE